MTAISHHNPFHCPIFHKFNPYIFLLYIIRLIYVYFANKSFCVVCVYVCYDVYTWRIVCIHVSKYGFMQATGCSWKSYCVNLNLLPWLTQGLFVAEHWIYTASCFMGFWRYSCFCLPVGTLRLQAQSTTQLSMESEDLKSSPHICTISILPTEPLPHTQLLPILCWK